MPSAASAAIRVSCGVRGSSGSGRRGRAVRPVARSSSSARVAQRVRSIAANPSAAAASCSRAAVRRPARRSHSPYSSRVCGVSKPSQASACHRSASSNAASAASPSAPRARQRATRAAVAGIGSRVTSAYRAASAAASARRPEPAYASTSSGATPSGSPRAPTPPSAAIRASSSCRGLGEVAPAQRAERRGEGQVGGDVQRAGPGDENPGVVEMPGGLLVPSAGGVLPGEQLRRGRGVGDVAQVRGQIHRLARVGEGTGVVAEELRAAVCAHREHGDQDPEGAAFAGDPESALHVRHGRLRRPRGSRARAGRRGAAAARRGGTGRTPCGPARAAAGRGPVPPRRCGASAAPRTQSVRACASAPGSAPAAMRSAVRTRPATSPEPVLHQGQLGQRRRPRRALGELGGLAQQVPGRRDRSGVLLQQPEREQRRRPGRRTATLGAARGRPATRVRPTSPLRNASETAAARRSTDVAASVVRAAARSSTRDDAANPERARSVPARATSSPASASSRPVAACDRCQSRVASSPDRAASARAPCAARRSAGVAAYQTAVRSSGCRKVRTSPSRATTPSRSTSSSAAAAATPDRSRAVATWPACPFRERGQDDHGGAAVGGEGGEGGLEDPGQLGAEREHGRAAAPFRCAAPGPGGRSPRAGRAGSRRSAR